MSRQIELKESSQRWLLMLLLVAGMIICYAERGALGVAAPVMIKELHLSKTVMGVLLSAFFWCYAFMQIPAGWLVDRFGVRKAYAVGFLIWTIASACTGLAGGLASLIVLQIVLGIGQSVAFPASARAVANWFPNSERGTVTACYLSGVRLGQALIGVVGVYLLVKYGWKLFFVLISVAPILWLLPWHMFLGKWERAAQSSASTEITEMKKSVSFFGSFALLRNRTVLGIFLGFFAFDYVWFVYTRWLNGYLVIERKFTPAETGFWTSAPYVVMSIIILISGVASDRLIKRGYLEIRVRKTFIVLGLAIALLIVPAGMVADKMTAVWLLSISLGGLGICAPNTWTLTQTVCSKNLVGTVSGIQNFGGNVGGIIAPALTGFIADRTQSFAPAFTICGLILVMGIFSYTFLIGKQALAREPEAEPAII